jgi:hypothetical protein
VQEGGAVQAGDEARDGKGAAVSDRFDERAAELVELRNPDGVEPHGPSVWVFGMWIDSPEPPADLAKRLRGLLAAELRKAVGS